MVRGILTLSSAAAIFALPLAAYADSTGIVGGGAAGAIVGGAVGGPVGAVVGGLGGASVGNSMTGPPYWYGHRHHWYAWHPYHRHLHHYYYYER